MTNFLSQRIQAIKPSATLAVTAKANELKAQGIDIISMSAGEPDFETPEHIKQAAIDAMSAGKTRYTAVDGTADLKQAIVNKLTKDNNLSYELDEVMVSCGGKQVFYNLVQAVLNPGDEVIIPAPYWVSYPDVVLLTDAKPVIVNTDIEQNFKINAEQLAAHITKKTKLLVLNSPSNPTGAVYSKEELSALADVLRQHPQILVLTDDIYEHIYWHDEPFCNLAMVADDLKDRIIILNGVSKAYAMTGWRIGYAAGAKTIIQAMKKNQSQSTSNPCSIAQAAAVAALNGKQDFVLEMLNAFRQRHRVIVDGLNQITGVDCPRSLGAFYSFPNVTGLVERLGLSDDIALATYCLEKLNIAIVPGSAFGAKNYLRFSFATSLEQINKALSRLNTL